MQPSFRVGFWARQRILRGRPWNRPARYCLPREYGLEARTNGVWLVRKGDSDPQNGWLPVAFAEWHRVMCVRIGIWTQMPVSPWVFP